MNPLRRGVARWRSSRTAAFAGRFNGSLEPIEDWKKAFPPRLRLRLAGGLFAVTAVAIAVRAPFFGSAFTAPDTAQYLSVAEGVFHGSGYSSNLRPPAYATLLAVFELLGLDSVGAAVTLQNLIGIVLPAGVLLTGWRFFSPWVGILAGFMTAASPLMIGIEQFALSDYLFSVVLFAATVVLAEAVLRMGRDERSPLGLLVLAGALFGAATLFRANGLFALVAIPAALVVAGRPWRPTLRASALAWAALAVVIAPWCIHNLIKFGDPNVASEGGISLYGRAVSYDEVPPSTDSADGRLARSVYNTADPNNQEAAVGTTIGTYNALVHQTGKSSTEAASAMGKLARGAVLENPGRYIERSIEILGRDQSVYDPQSLTSDPSDQIATIRAYIGSLDATDREAPGNSNWTRVPWQIAQTLSRLLFILTIGGLLMLALPFLGPRHSRQAASAFLIVGFLDILAVALTARFEARHAIVLAPMVWVLSAATVGLALSLLAALVRWPRSRTPTRVQGVPT